MPQLHDTVLDAGGAVVDNATAIHLTENSAGEPADRAAVITNSLANATLTPGAGNGDFTVADGDVSGRKLTIAAQTGVPVTTDGTAGFVCLIDGSILLASNTLSATQAVTTGNNVDIGSWKVEFHDPTAV